MKDAVAIAQLCSARTMDAHEAYVTVQACKRKIVSKRLLVQGVRLLEEYPLDVGDFMRQFPQVFTLELPAPCRVDVMRIGQLTRKDMMPARSGNAVLRGSSQVLSSQTSACQPDRKADQVLKRLLGEAPSASNKLPRNEMAIPTPGCYSRDPSAFAPTPLLALEAMTPLSAGALTPMHAMGGLTPLPLPDALPPALSSGSSSFVCEGDQVENRTISEVPMHAEDSNLQKILEDAQSALKNNKTRGGGGDAEDGADEVQEQVGKPAETPRVAAVYRRPAASPTAQQDSMDDLLRQLPADYQSRFLQRDTALRLGRNAFGCRGYGAFKSADISKARVAYLVNGRFWDSVHMRPPR